MKSEEGKEEEGGNKQRHRQFPQKGSWVQIICINNNLRGSQRQKYMERERGRREEEELRRDKRNKNYKFVAFFGVGCWLFFLRVGT